MAERSGWTSPAEIVKSLERLWARGALLQVPAAVDFPFRVRLSRPSSKELSERFTDAQAWIRALDEGARKHGYRVEAKEIEHRQLGRNLVPVCVWIDSEADALRMLGRIRDVSLYRQLAGAIGEEFPALKAWLQRRALLVLELSEDWPRLLAVLRFFRNHPSPGLYRRQLEIEGVDTKFIESQRKILGEVLPLILPSEHVRDEPGASFDKRFGLREKPALLRFRILDESLYIQGLSDLTVPVDALARLDLAVDEVIVTENEVNGLALPPRERTMVIFGQGYANERLAELPWLSSRRLRYWGDIDTHGFTMLDRFRAHFPASESLLMDRETLLAHKAMWVHEATPSTERLTRLTADEAALADELSRGVHGDRIRLEQERISFARVRRHLSIGAKAPVSSDRFPSS